MKPYYHTGDARLYLSDCREAMAAMGPESVDSIVTDPPYGLSFMGKGWDHGVPGVPFWTEALRVAKPGAHLLAFGGTRTFHRLAVAIEDAGWEIRDTVMWVYGSGFPKSLDVSKAIDKAAGAEREVVGERPSWRPAQRKGAKGIESWTDKDEPAPAELTAPATKAARRWSGWGTALKPAYEIIIGAQKPHTWQGVINITAHNITEALCQLPSLAKDAGRTSELNRSASGEACDSALWTVVEKCSTPAALYEAMDTWPSGSAIPTSLSIALSWLDTLAALLEHGSTFTTETATSLTTDLRTLNSSPSAITPAVILGDAIHLHGTGSSASLAASTFSAVEARLRLTLTRSAHERATGPEPTAPLDGVGELYPSFEPIIVARKPLPGTVAENVQEHGTGALNVDGCRVETGPPAPRNAPKKVIRGGKFRAAADTSTEISHFNPTQGRWPANLIHDGSEEVVRLFPDEAGGGNARPSTEGHGSSMFAGNGRVGFTLGDSGSAARFFYCAKADKADRTEGGQVKNRHPTVKPTDLMRYLCRLVTPPGGVVLDPFMGSGSTGKAALIEGFRFTGIEKEEESIRTARDRIRLGEAAQRRMAL